MPHTPVEPQSDPAPPADAEDTTCPPDHRQAAGDTVGERSPREIGGRPGPEPTRFGDWEKDGRCIDF